MNGSVAKKLRGDLAIHDTRYLEVVKVQKGVAHHTGQLIVDPTCGRGMYKRAKKEHTRG